MVLLLFLWYIHSLLWYITLSNPLILLVNLIFQLPTSTTLSSALITAKFLINMITWWSWWWLRALPHLYSFPFILQLTFLSFNPRLTYLQILNLLLLPETNFQPKEHVDLSILLYTHIQYSLTAYSSSFFSNYLLCSSFF